MAVPFPESESTHKFGKIKYHPVLLPIHSSVKVEIDRLLSWQLKCAAFIRFSDWTTLDGKPEKEEQGKPISWLSIALCLN